MNTKQTTTLNATLTYVNGSETYTTERGVYVIRKFMMRWAIYEAATMQMCAQRDYLMDALTTADEWEREVVA